MKWIGIDPDVDKSGFAVWDSDSKTLEVVFCESFFEILENIEFQIISFDVTVIIEAGWLIKKSNWHNKKRQTKAVGEKIAKAVGANHQIGKLFVEYCKINNIKFIEVKPMGKKNAEQFKKITGWAKRTNSEVRDAAMLVYGR